LTGLSDEAAARLIHADGVHVLIDMSGHTGYNRLPVFAWKPAPVQVSWLGYFATTGVAEIDYLLADQVGVPEARQAQFTESLWYLPDTRLCFTAPAADLAVAPLPALANGRITFGCFQNLTKVNEGVLELWGKVMAALPDATLRLQCKQFSEPALVAQLQQRLQRHGIDPARVATHGSAQRAAYLAAHAEVDMILDTFPYPGGTTTCEALWMGVPTLTLAGDSLLARQGASLLSAAGLAQWVANSQEEYVAKAVAFASDLPELAALRAGLREQVLASPLFDAPRFARHFEEALWGMWQHHRAGQGEPA
jgi:protein O-GlcNAc transferase